VLPARRARAGGRGIDGDRLAWARSAPVLAVACADTAGNLAILFWDVDRQAQLARWDADFDTKMLRLAVAPDGKRLAAGHADGTIRVYDLAARAESLRLEATHPGGVGMLSWLADGRLLSADIFGNTYTFWEPSGAPLASALLPGGETISDLGFSPDGHSLAVLRGGKRPAVFLVERDSGRAAPALPLTDKLSPNVLCFRPDGRQLAAARGLGAVVWDLPGREEKSYSLPGRQGWAAQVAVRPAFLADGRLLAVENHLTGAEMRFAVRDFVTGREVGPEMAAPLTAGTALFLTDGRLSADGRLLVGIPSTMGRSHDPLVIWDVATGRRTGEMSRPDLGAGLMDVSMSGLSADGNWFYQFSHPGGLMGLDFTQLRLRFWDVANRRHHADLPVSAEPSAVVTTRDGGLLAIGYENGSAEVWDVRHQEQLFRWQPTGAKRIKPMAFTPDADFLACADERGVVYLLSLAQLRRQLADMGLDW
jgi:WD40 repeat protein